VLGSLADIPVRELMFVAVDVETTGLDPREEKVVEVGAFRFDKSGARGSYEQLVNPGRPIPKPASAVHGITDRMVAWSPSLTRILLDVVRFFGDSVLLAHNAKFDIGFFDVAFEEARVAPPANAILCTRELARVIYPGLSNYKLSTLANFLGIRPIEEHRALPDAINSAEVFMHCMSQLDPAWDFTFGELVKIYGAPFCFRASPTRSLERIQRALSSGSSLTITYCARNGRITQRDITPLSIEGAGLGAKIVAYCHLRRENRTFRLDCITKIV
jgi:DNA polymerase III epsilon subunit family exonuclease